MNHQATVRAYYGETLKQSGDLSTDACCTIGEAPVHIRPLLGDIHPDVAARYYGCGFVAPLALEGARVLDLGCGAGKDAYLLSRLVGETGSVVGVDMTPEQLAVAHAHRDWHAERFGYAASNVEFLEGDIERLGELGLAPQSFDVIVSNCVINLCADKPAVFESVHALLKEGGEFYFADVYTDRPLSETARAHPKAHGECLAGALTWADFLAIARAAGFPDPRRLTQRPLTIDDTDLQDLLAPARFSAATYRLIKADGLQTAPDDCGGSIIYKGGIAGAEDAFAFDEARTFSVNEEAAVCANTFRMLKAMRFAPYFEFRSNGALIVG